MARWRTPTERLVGPVKTALQLAPASVLLKTPAVPVPAYTVEGALGSMARAPTTGACTPVLTALQLAPPAALLKTAPPAHASGKELLVGPASRVVGEGQAVGNVIGQPGVDGGPPGPAVGALEDAADATRVEGGGGLGVDRQGAATACVQPGADGGPALPAVGALEDATAARVEGPRGLGVDCQGNDPD